MLTCIGILLEGRQRGGKGRGGEGTEGEGRGGEGRKDIWAVRWRYIRTHKIYQGKC